MLNRRNLKKRTKYTKRQKRAICLFGILQIRRTASTRQPLFCHRWDGADNKDWGNQEQKSPFNNVLQEAYSVLMNMDLETEVDDYPAALEKLRHFVFVDDIKVTREQFKRMLLTYKSVVEHRAEHWRQQNQEPSDVRCQESSTKKLLSCNKGVWGSRRQWACGEVISRLLSHFRVTERGNDLHPVFAIMLNPQGGIAGSGNMSLLTGDMHNSVIVHAVVHDAFGYAYRAHNVGPSYNYLAINSVFANDSCLSCQAHGIMQVRHELKQLGLLGDKGRSNRALEMVAWRQELTSQHREGEYPEDSLITERGIKADYESRRNISVFKSVGTVLKQLLLNVHMMTWKPDKVVN